MIYDEIGKYILLLREKKVNINRIRNVLDFRISSFRI